MFDEFKRLLKHSIIFGMGALISKAVGFLMIPVYTHYLSPKDYGIIEILTLTSSVIVFALFLALSSSILRFYFSYDTEKEKKQVMSTGLISAISGMLLVVIILFSSSDRLSLFFFRSVVYSHYFKLIFATAFFELALGISLTYLRAKEQSVFFIAISLFRLIMALSLNIYLIVFLKMGILGVLYSSLITNSFVCIAMLFITFREINFSFSIKKLKEMLNYGFPFIPSSLGFFILSFADRYFLQHFSSLNEVGLYSLGYKFAMMLGILITEPFQQIWNVFMFSVAKKDNAEQIYSRVLTYFGFVIIFAGLGLSMLCKEIMKIIATPAFFDAYKVIPIVTLGYIFYGTYNIFPIGIYFKKKTKYLAYIVISAALFNLLLNWILIPKYNMMGAGIATMLSYLYLSSCTYIVSERFYSISYEFRRISKILFVGISLYMCSQLISINSTFYSIFIKSLLLLSFPIFMYFVKFYEKEELHKLKELLNMSFSKIQLILNQNIVKVGN